MGENMKKILIIFVMILMPVFAHGVCTTMTTSPDISYTSETTINLAYQGAHGTQSSCKNTAVKYYVDTTKKVYSTVTTCTSCETGYTSQSITVFVGDCSFTASYCSYCSISTTRPNNISSLGGNHDITNCSTLGRKYIYSSTANGYFEVKSCSQCANGYSIQKSPMQINFSDCGLFYYYECQRDVCNAGYYGSGGDDCTECPNKTDAYTSSSLSTNPSRRDGYIMSDRGSTTVDDCYLKDGTYYDATGAWTHGATCFYDGTSGGTVTDKCATVSYACLSYTGTANTAVSAKPNSSSGAACWCTANNKSIYLSTMGPSVAPTYTANCESGCPSACGSKVAGDSTWRTLLGCDS